jgi:hypothetical protein
MPSTEQAAKRIRGQVRRLLMETASFSIRELDEVSGIKTSARRAEINRLRAATRDVKELEELVEEFDRENQELQTTIRQLKEEADTLRADLFKARSVSAATGASQLADDDLQPETESPPATLEEAVIMAQDRHDDDLLFGTDVDAGIKTVKDSAGPPDKVLQWLGVLAGAARRRRDGSLGRDVIRWLRERNIACSPESETNRKDPRERAKRTWDGGGKPAVFEHHMKPKEGTSPDQCVRIYFRWHSKRKRYVIGWIGRHP